MITRFSSIVAVLTLIGSAGSKTISVHAAQGAPPVAASRRTVAFVDVNVVPMDTERVLERQTVVVREGRIAAMGATDRIEVPKKALRIDGRGRYLMPGLVDMHVHLYTPQEFLLYLAHAEEYVYTAFGRNVEDEDRIPAVAAATRDAEVPVTFTLVFYAHILRQAGDLPSFLKRSELRYLAPWARVLWGPGLNRYNPRLSAAKDQQFLERSLAFQRTLPKSLHQAGVRILAGTDAMTPGAVPGFTLLEELQNLAELGMSPFEVIRAATRYPAEFLSLHPDFGTVAVGQRADLILITGNPLANVSNVQRRVGVMTRGDWRTEAQLQKMLGEIPGAYARAQRHVESLLTRDPSAASRYMEENDPFEYVALAAELNLIVREGVSPFRKIYRDLQNVRPGLELFFEDNLNAFAHRLLELNRRNEAIALLAMNLEAHPQSAKVCDRRAEAYLKNGDKELAIAFYKKAVQIDPKFGPSLEALQKFAP